VAEFGQGGIGVLGHEAHQAEAVVFVELAWGAPGVGSGGDGAVLAAALEEAADPGGGNVEEVGELRTRSVALVASAHDAVAEVLRVGLHAEVSFLLSLYADRYSQVRTALKAARRGHEAGRGLEQKPGPERIVRVENKLVPPREKRPARHLGNDPGIGPEP